MDDSNAFMLSYFYKQIYVKEVLKTMIEKLENEIMLLVCKMEKYSFLCGLM
jgi:hypothetical protein